MMSHRLLLILLLNCLTLSSSAQDTTRYYKELGGFWVYFPEKPVVEFKDEQNKAKETTTLFYFNAKEISFDTLYYSVTYFDVPAYEMSSTSHGSAYELFNTLVYKSVDYQEIQILDSFTDESVPFIASKEYILKAVQGEELMRVKFYLCENRVYYLKLVYKEAGVESPGIERFFNSFEIDNVKWRVRLTHPKVEEVFKRIEIKFPSAPLSQLDAAHGTAMVSYRKIASTDSISFMAVISILPDVIEHIKGFKLKKEYEKIVKELENIPGTVVLYQREIFNDQHKGREIKFITQGMICQMRVFFYSDMSIKLTVSYAETAETVNEKAINDYFNSFKIKE